MCEMPSAFWQRNRRARKDHQCCECGRPIHKGSDYEVISGIWDSRPGTFKTCFDCVDVRKKYHDQLDRYDCLELGELYQTMVDAGESLPDFMPK